MRANLEGSNTAEVAGVPRVWDAGEVLDAAGVLAHQGGWDEALMVIAPVGLFAGLLWAATRRAGLHEDGADATRGER